MLIKIFIFLIFILVLILSSFVSYGAQFDYPWSGITEVGGQSGLVAKFYQIALALVGVTAFAVMVFAGVLYIVNASNPSKQKEAMDWIWAAVFGVVLLLGAYLLFYTINPVLTELKLSDITEVPISPVTYSTSSEAFQKLIYGYNIGACGSGWTQVAENECIDRGEMKLGRPDQRSLNVCCKFNSK